MNLFKKIGKGIGVFFIFIIMLGVVISTFSNDSSDEGKNDANISREELLEQNKDKADSESTNINDEEYTNIEITDYYRNINDYIDKPVKLTGFWSFEYNDGYINDFDYQKSIKLNLSEEIINSLSTTLLGRQRINVYGKGVKDDKGNIVFETEKIQHYLDTQYKNYWNGSKLLNEDTINELTTNSYDPSAEYEFTATVLNDQVISRDVILDGTGLVINLDLPGSYEIPNGKTIKILASNVVYDDYYEVYKADFIDYKSLD